MKGTIGRQRNIVVLALAVNLKSRITKKMIRKRIERLAVDAYHMGLDSGAVVAWLREEVKRLKFPKK